jgi:hypothetical protein
MCWVFGILEMELDIEEEDPNLSLTFHFRASYLISESETHLQNEDKAAPTEC